MADDTVRQGVDVSVVAMGRWTVSGDAPSDLKAVIRSTALAAAPLTIRTTGEAEALDPVRYWSVLEGDRRIGRVCLIFLPEHVGAVLWLWTERGHPHEGSARRMLLNAAHGGLYRSACVKVIADASVAHHAAWQQIVDQSSMTARSGVRSNRWREYYVNIYQRRHGDGTEMATDCASSAPASHRQLPTGTGEESGAPLSLNSGKDDPGSPSIPGYIDEQNP